MADLYRVPFPPDYGSMKRLSDMTPKQREHIERAKAMEAQCKAAFYKAEAERLTKGL